VGKLTIGRKYHRNAEKKDKKQGQQFTAIRVDDPNLVRELDDTRSIIPDAMRANS